MTVATDDPAAGGWLPPGVKQAPPPSFEERIAATHWGRDRADVAALMREGPPEVEFLPSPRLGEGLVYVRTLALLSGHKKSLKSWAAAILAADMLEAGRPIIYIDRENGGEIFAERLLLVGADPDVVERLFVYVPFPTSFPIEELRAEVEAWASIMPDGLLIYDSLRSLVSEHGGSSNDADEVEKVIGPIMGAIKNQAPEGRFAGIIIDHANRTTSGSSLYAHGGSHAKSEAVDVVYYVEKHADIDVDMRGTVEIAPKDDRRGRLGRPRFYAAGGQGLDAPFHWERTNAPPPEPTKASELAERAARLIHEVGELRRADVAERLEVPANGTLDDALQQAVERGWIEKPEVRGRAYTPTEKTPPPAAANPPSLA